MAHEAQPFSEVHWPYVDAYSGVLTGCHCGFLCNADDWYGDGFVRHIYELGFIDGEAFRSAVDDLN